MKGLIHVYTGNGKGKTTAAMGLAVRALGYGKRVFIMQFLKGQDTGERHSLKNFPELTFKKANNSKKFFLKMDSQEKEQLQKEINQSWEEINKITVNSDYDLVILDEVLIAVNNNLLTIEQVRDLMRKKDKEKELILTGRGAPEEIIELADYCTEMKMIKHPYNQNIPARRGIEF